VIGQCRKKLYTPIIKTELGMPHSGPPEKGRLREGGGESVMVPILVTERKTPTTLEQMLASKNGSNGRLPSSLQSSARENARASLAHQQWLGRIRP